MQACRRSRINKKGERKINILFFRLVILMLDASMLIAG
jgi:hypothetical protein